jgi:hypothetical protein
MHLAQRSRDTPEIVVHIEVSGRPHLAFAPFAKQHGVFDVQHAVGAAGRSGPLLYPCFGLP